MRTLPRIPSTAQLRTLEADWIKKCHAHWGQVLMEIAGRGAAEVAHRIWRLHPGPVAVFCGKGNNGGDGFVVARYLSLWGAKVHVYLVGSSKAGDGPLKMNTEESNANERIADKMGIPVSPLPDDLDGVLSDCRLVIDALLGTGLDRTVEGPYRKTIDAINRARKPVVAVDLPSGINSDTGQTMGAAIRATETVTFGYLKPGLLQHPGTSLAGRITVVDIGLPEIGESEEIFLTTGDFVRAALPQRPSDSNKGTFGSTLMIGGSAGMFGATILASETALRAGAGLSILAAPKSIIPHLPAAEVIYKLLPETDATSISEAAIEVLQPEIEKASAIILGPGLSQQVETVTFVQKLLPILSKSAKRCIIDADALNAISHNREAFPSRAANFVLTPHPKELSRLMGNSVDEIQQDRIASVRKAAAKYGCTVVLKGSRTVTSDVYGSVYINPTGNSGMATAGAGDVLSGIIGGLMAQGVSPFEAAVASVYLHGLAGDIAATEIGDAGIVAGDIAKKVPTAAMHIRSGVVSRLELELLGAEPN